MLAKVYRCALKFLVRLTSILNKYRIIMSGGTVGSGFYCDGWLKIYNKGKIIIGDNVTINSSFSANPISGDVSTVFVVRPGAILEIQDGVAISNTIFACGLAIKVGGNAFLGSGCKIYDNDFHSLKLGDRLSKPEVGVTKRPVNIGEGCFLGASVTVLKGVDLGDECVVGACSLVCKSIPNAEVWGGNPAKFIKVVS